MPPLARDELVARRALGNSNTEVIRALKRHFARRVFTLLRSAVERLFDVVNQGSEAAGKFRK